MLPLLLPIIGQLVPALVGHLFGSNAENVAQQVTTVTQAVFGSTDPAAIQQQMAADAQKALDYKMKLLDVQSAENQRQHEERMAEFTDTESARTTFATNPKVFWLGFAILSIAGMMMASVCIGSYLILTHGIDIKDAGTIAAVFTLIGAIIRDVVSSAQQVVTCFFGRSAQAESDSAALNTTIGKTAQALAKGLGHK